MKKKVETPTEPPTSPTGINLDGIKWAPDEPAGQINSFAQASTDMREAGIFRGIEQGLYGPILSYTDAAGETKRYGANLASLRKFCENPPPEGTPILVVHKGLALGKPGSKPFRLVRVVLPEGFMQEKQGSL
jgi:hypothetical protein